MAFFTSGFWLLRKKLIKYSKKLNFSISKKNFNCGNWDVKMCEKGGEKWDHSEMNF